MLGHFRTFVTVIEHETISEAAEILHSTQPTVTRQIQQLERELCVSLFDRVGKRLILTRAGERVYHYARELLQTNIRMLDELSQLTDPEQGIIRIGAGITPTIYRLPAVLTRYRFHHPGIRFEVMTGSSQITVDRLQQREVDIGLVTTAPADLQGIETIPLWHDDLLVVASPTNRLAGTTCTLAELRDMPMVLMRAGSGLREIVEERFSPDGGKLNMVFETDSLEAMNRFVQMGIGIAVLPRSVVQDDIQSERLKTIMVADVQLGARTITALIRAGAGMTAATSAFVAALPRLAREAEKDSLWRDGVR